MFSFAPAGEPQVGDPCTRQKQYVRFILLTLKLTPPQSISNLQTMVWMVTNFFFLFLCFSQLVLSRKIYWKHFQEVLFLI